MLIIAHVVRKTDDLQDGISRDLEVVTLRSQSLKRRKEEHKEGTIDSTTYMLTASLQD